MENWWRIVLLTVLLANKHSTGTRIVGLLITATLHESCPAYWPLYIGNVMANQKNVNWNLQFEIPWQIDPQFRKLLPLEPITRADRGYEFFFFSFFFQFFVPRRSVTRRIRISFFENFRNFPLCPVKSLSWLSIQTYFWQVIYIMQDSIPNLGLSIVHYITFC